MNRKPKPIRIEGEVAYVTLTKGKEAIIDSCDIGTVKEFGWHALSPADLFYAARGVHIGGKKKVLLMHREIIGAEKGVHVDHINGNGLDNRRLNLRIASHAQNMRNRKINANNKTGFKGVSFDKKYNKYMPCIRINGKTKHLGSYDTAEEAYSAYCKASAELHGEFGRLK